MSYDINFDEIFKIMLFAMNINRCHPDLPRDRKWMCQFVVMHGFFFMVFCLLIYSTIFFDIKNGDLTKACANGILCIIFGVVTLKYCVMLRYQSLIKGLINEMKVDYETAKSFCPSERRIICNYAKRGKKVVDLWIIISTVGAGLFVMKSFCLMFYYWFKGDFQLVPLYDLTYPTPVEEVKNEPAVYFLLYVMFLLYDGYAMIMYIAVAALGPVFMLHGCGQLELVKRRLLSIYGKNDTEETTLKKLKDIVKHLQIVYGFLERIQTSFQILYELTLKACTIILPITFYQVIQSYHDGDLRVEFITIIIGGITLCSVPCYYSDELMDMGENVRLAVYMCGWETQLHKRKGILTMLLLIHSRAARAVAIRTLFRTISLDALTDLLNSKSSNGDRSPFIGSRLGLYHPNKSRHSYKVYHQAYAIFNVLNAASR